MVKKGVKKGVQKWVILGVAGTLENDEISMFLEQIACFRDPRPQNDTFWDPFWTGPGNTWII